MLRVFGFLASMLHVSDDRCNMDYMIRATTSSQSYFRCVAPTSQATLASYVSFCLLETLENLLFVMFSALGKGEKEHNPISQGQQSCNCPQGHPSPRSLCPTQKLKAKVQNLVL